jgi:hypothetical protein
MKLVIEEVVENEDGTSNIKFDYDEEFLEVVKKELDTETPTEEQINEFIMKVIVSKMQEENK